MPKIYKGLIIAVLLALPACSTNERPENKGGSADSGTAFATYAQELYRELDETPLSDSVEVDIGMFGDLNVMSGENVVMGRYRYRVDTVRGDVSGHLTFFARSDVGDEAVPVMLAFGREDGFWMLREATYVTSDEDDGEASPLEKILDRHLDEWARQAASDVTSSSIRVLP